MRPFPSRPSTPALALALGLLGACGSRGEAPTPPRIWGLQLARSQASWNEGGGSLPVDFSVSVADGGADVVRLVALFRDGLWAPVGTASLPVGTAGRGEATVRGTLSFPTSRAGALWVELQAVDARGAASAPALAEFGVAPEPPVLASLSPPETPRVAPDAAGTRLLLTAQGGNFGPNPQLVWGTLGLQATPLDEATLTAEIPGYFLDQAGTFEVRLRSWDYVTGLHADSAPLTFTVTEPGPPLVLSALSPAGVAAEGPALTLTATGSGFAPGAAIHWGLVPLPTVRVDDGTLQASVPSYLLAAPGTTQVTAVNTAPRAVSAPIGFVVGPAPDRPVPTLDSLSPAAVEASAEGALVTLRGSGFGVGSRVLLDGQDVLPVPAVLDGATLRVRLPAGASGAPYLRRVSVRNLPPGGGFAAERFFEVRPRSLPGMRAVALFAEDLAFDPYGRRLYGAVPTWVSLQPGTVSSIDPATGERGALRAVEGHPWRVAASSDGRWLWVATWSPSRLLRLALPSLEPDLSIDTLAPVTEIAPSPVDGQTAAVILSWPPGSTTAIYDGGVARPLQGSGDGEIAWAPDGSALHADGEGGRRYPVGAAGLGTPTALVAGYPAGAAVDPSTGFLWGAGGTVVDPAADRVVGACAGLTRNPAVLPEPSLGLALFTGAGTGLFGTEGVALAECRLDDLSLAQTALFPLDLPGLFADDARRARAVRWRADGVALRAGSADGTAYSSTSRALLLFEGPTVLPPPATPNPAPVASALAPASAPAGSGNLRVTVTGSGFVPGTAVHWNGAERYTVRNGDAELVAYVPASDLAAGGSAEVTVVTPAPGGGTSAPLSFTVAP